MLAFERLAGLRRLADRTEAHRLFGRALSLATDLEDRETEARVRNSLAILAWQGGEIEEAEKQYSKAAELLRHDQNNEDLGVVLNGLGAVVTRQNRASEALEILKEALAFNGEHGQRGAEADSLAALGAAARAAGDLTGSGSWYRQCVERRRELGDRAGEGWALQRLSEVSHDAGEGEKAQAFSVAALAIGRETGDKDLETLADKLQSTDKTKGSE
jgi:tetratricopeptide (TPR) repeat protein